MTTLKDLYEKLLNEPNNGKELNYNRYDKSHLDCLLYPGKQSLERRFDQYPCAPEQRNGGDSLCPFDALLLDGDTTADDKRTGCNACIDDCKGRKLLSSRDIIPALKSIRKHKGLTYALVAPAFLGQFSKEVTPGKLRTALKQIGFDGMIEVSLFADILTLKESLEFINNIVDDTDYQLTSCCCPMWIAMIRKFYRELMPHVPGSVSPMIASGRTIKHIHPDAVTVFIGPCMAKKAEAREPDLAGAIDYVLTFQEVRDIFEALDIDPSEMEESAKDHSSRAGRIYARSGGVSEAVKLTVERLNPNRTIKIRTQRADGVPACKAMINDLLAGKSNANFFEGMGCNGGCIGGPKAIIGREQALENVNEYGDEALYPTPIDNPYVIELLIRLGFDTVESLLKDNEIFTRHL